MKDLIIIFLAVAVIWLTMMLITTSIFNCRMSFYRGLSDCDDCKEDEIDLCEGYIDIYENDLYKCIKGDFFRFFNWPKELGCQIIELQRDYAFMKEKVKRNEK